MVGQGSCRFFATEAERERFIEVFQEQLARNGNDFDPANVRRWQETARLAPDVDRGHAVRLDTFSFFAHNLCKMKNLTLRIDEKKLSAARRIAMDRSTSVNALVREYLDELIQQESRSEAVRRDLVALCGESTAEIGSAMWTRESLYDR